MLVSLRQSPDVFFDFSATLIESCKFFKLPMDLFGNRRVLGKHMTDSEQYLQRTSRLHELFSGILEAACQVSGKGSLNQLVAVLILFECEGLQLRWVSDQPTKSFIWCTLGFPDAFLCKSVDHAEQFHEEDAQVFRLLAGATMDRGNDTEEYLRENIAHVDVGNLKFNQ